MKLSAKFALILSLGILFSTILSFVMLVILNDLIPLRGQTGLIGEWMLTVAFGVIPISLILWWVMEHLILERVHKFNRVAETIANGDLSVRIDDTSRDEIGEMGRNMNLVIGNTVRAMQSMADSLRDTIIKERQLDTNLKELSKEQAQDEALLTSIGEGVVAIDSKGQVVFINSEALSMLGFPEGEVVGNDWQAIIAPFVMQNGHLEPMEDKMIERALEKGIKIHSNCYYKRYNNLSFPASVTISPVMLDGKANGVILAFRDITKDMEVDRMKTEFISLASHQLRTPLSAINWFSELLMENVNGTLGPEDIELAENINQSTKRMVDLVGSLLNISRIESGRIIIEPVPTNIVELVKDTIKELEVKISEKNHTVNFNTDDNLPIVNIDPKLIRHVYMNLLTNAIKYTPSNGTITVDIRKDGDNIISKVTDTGFGIPKKDYSRIFQKFFRADNVVKVETDGSGLGLYLVKTIVETSKGKIWFESEEGKGTTFIFTLPITGMTAKKGEVTLG